MFSLNRIFDFYHIGDTMLKEGTQDKQKVQVVV